MQITDVKKESEWKCCCSCNLLVKGARPIIEADKGEEVSDADCD